MIQEFVWYLTSDIFASYGIISWHPSSATYTDVFQVGISFVQIGSEQLATEYLQELDDDLPKAGIRDMVDTTPYTVSLDTDPDMLVKVLLGGVHRRVDVKGGRVLVQRQKD